LREGEHISARTGKPATGDHSAKKPTTIKLFMDGRIQAVRLLKEFRLQGAAGAARRAGRL
jgi:hypothetical protein